MEALGEAVLPLEKKPRIDCGDGKEMIDSSISEGTKSQSPAADDHESPRKPQLEDPDGGILHQSDESSDEGGFSYDKISDEDFQRYSQELEVSGGYDISEVDHPFPGCIQPLSLNETTMPSLTRFLLGAIDMYNNENNTEVRLLNIVKVNYTSDITGRFYYTFEAKDDVEGEPKTYQAELFVRWGGKVAIEQFRQKPAAE